MERLPEAAYTPEFREQAVRLYEEGGLTLVEAAKRLSMPNIKQPSPDASMARKR